MGARGRYWVVDVSVIIPTMGRPEKIAACTRALAAQSLGGDRYEVLIGLDGPNEPSARAAAEAWRIGNGRPGGLSVVVCPREGYNGVRNRLLPLAKGRTLVSMNDDVTAVPGLLEAHHREHALAADKGRVVIVSGYSPWKVHQNETLLDRIVRETSMIFFYDQMLLPDGMPRHEPDHDWGYRHCWGLNFSAPLGAAREVGGFTAFDLQYGYDDIEFAHRLRQRYGAPVLFRPTARAEHDHRYGAREILTREWKLGVSAWHFAKARPAFCAELFGRDIHSNEELAYSREFVSRERSAAARLRNSFEDLESIPGHEVSGPHAAGLINLVYQQHLLLKRWMWRAGLAAAAEGRETAQVSWPE
jgi:glycosyltransferase involved in cell wall biosynthesis